MNPNTANIIGSVEILNRRVYPLDGEALDPYLEGIVESGTYPLYEYGDFKFWVMEGVLDMGGMQRHGDGLLIFTPGNVDSNIPVRFPSKRYGPDQWKDFLDHPVCIEDHPQQRLRITLNSSADVTKEELKDIEQVLDSDKASGKTTNEIMDAVTVGVTPCGNPNCTSCYPGWPF